MTMTCSAACPIPPATRGRPTIDDTELLARVRILQAGGRRREAVAIVAAGYTVTDTDRAATERRLRRKLRAIILN